MTIKRALLATVFAVVVALSAHNVNATNGGVTVVNGRVTNNGTAVAGASVVVTCGSSTSAPKTTKADGTYTATFSAASCPDGSTASATASKDGKAGSDSGTVSQVAEASEFGIDLNIALVNVALVPEYGMITGITSLVAAGGVWYYLRSRQNVATPIA